MKDIIKEIDEKYPINENFKKQFEEFESNIKNLDEMKKDFERKKELMIQKIEYYCKNQKTLEFNYDVLLDNIQQICKECAVSHAINDESKDMKYMMCQFYLKQIDLLANSEIEQYRYSDFFESARKSLWENIKTLDEKSGVHLFPKNIDEIKQKFEANKEKFQQSKNYSEFAEYCRECNPYTAFQGLRNRVNFPLKDHSLDKFVPNMREYKELKITDNDLKTALLTCLDYSSPSEFDQSDWFFRNSLFRKMDFHPNTIWNTFGKILNYKNFDQKDLKYEQALEIMFDKNNDLEVYSIEFFNDKSSLLFKVNNVGSNFSFNKNIIYVMDEPAAHLSVLARKEFRKFLKEYAHKHNTTFVLATHDPFLVDTDHLDEIRIVEKKKKKKALRLRIPLTTP